MRDSASEHGTRQVLDTCLRLAVAGATREYPHFAGPTLRSADDLRRPREQHPAFYGCFDWHSSVHAHWTMARIARLEPDLEGVDRARAILADHLTADNLQIEADRLRADKSFERPYGWSWALRLDAELRADDATAPLAEATTPLVDVIVGHTQAYLPRLTWPIRAGTHANTAYALAHMLDWARLTGHDSMHEELATHAFRLYGDDRGWPIEFEPSGEDFLSPGLTEADLMRRVLDVEAFTTWLDDFIPDLASRLPAPIERVDARDGRLGHLAGLNLSRAVSLRALGEHAAADAHLACGLAQVETGSYAGEHWLGTFATYAITEGWR